jgi:hypothetical protein
VSLPVLVPYTRLHPRTGAALERYRDTTYVQLDPDDDRHYWAVLAEWWDRGEAFVIVEHDIEIHGGVLGEFEACPEPWCTFPYARLLCGPHSSWSVEAWGPGIPLLDKSLGCTRFSAELVRAEWDLLDRLGEWSIGGSPPGHWKRLDDGSAVLLHERGYQVHVHHPEVTHHHWLGPQGWNACTCGEEGCGQAAA